MTRPSKRKQVLVRIDADAFDLWLETLAMDSESGAFDRKLREQIAESLTKFEVVG